jgi:hypothetical protein
LPREDVTAWCPRCAQIGSGRCDDRGDALAWLAAGTARPAITPAVTSGAVHRASV